MRFGPAGIPIKCKGNTVEGIRFTKKLGLACMELQFGHGIMLGDALAEECRKAALEEKIILSAHAPYYVNLLSSDKRKQGASKHRILETARVLHKAGGGRVVFHPGYYGELGKAQAFKVMAAQFDFLLKKVKAEKLNVVLSPETTGKLSAWGDLDELLEMAKKKKTSLTIDFAHLHARCNGCLKKEKDFLELLKKVEKKLGRKALKNLHIHFSGIAYTEKGERHHLPVSSNSPPYRELLKALKRKRCNGTIISESPLIEEDALLLQKTWKKL